MEQQFEVRVLRATVNAWDTSSKEVDPNSLGFASFTSLRSGDEYDRCKALHEELLCLNLGTTSRPFSLFWMRRLDDRVYFFPPLLMDHQMCPFRSGLVFEDCVVDLMHGPQCPDGFASSRGAG